MIQNSSRTKKLVMISLLIAMQIVATRFLSVQLPTLRIGFGFLPTAICSMMFGPLAGGMAAAIADILGMAIAPAANVYFPGFTLTAFLTGVTYGVFTCKYGVKPLTVTISVVIVCLFLNLVVDTFWLHMMYDKAFLVMIPTRVVKSAIMVPIQISLIMLIWRGVICRLTQSYS